MYNSILDTLYVHNNIANKDKTFLQQFYTVIETTTISKVADGEWYLYKEALEHTDKEGELYYLENKLLNLSLCLDFQQGNYQHRNKHLGKEPLAQAVKIKKKLPETLIDTTPGVMKDSIMLAYRGVHITAIERNPLLYVMVKRALDNLLANNQTLSINYIFADAIEELQNHRADIIYLDPMYPKPKNKKKQAQVKKDMQVLHHIIGDDIDADKLFVSARQQNTRIVVKRPSYAEYIANDKPDFISQIGSTRFDIYLP